MDIRGVLSLAQLYPTRRIIAVTRQFLSQVCTGSQQEASENVCIHLICLSVRHKYSPLRTNTAYPVIPASAIPELECVVCTGSQQEASENVCIHLICLSVRHKYSLPRTNTAYPVIPASAIPELECVVCTGSQQEASEMFVFTSIVCQSDTTIPELECVVCTGSQQEASEMFVFTSIVCQPDTTTHYRAQTLLILLFLLQQFPSLSVHNYSLPRTNTAYPVIPASAIPELECVVCTVRHKYSPLRTNTAYPVIPASAIPELECVVCTVRHKYSPLRTNTAYPVIPASAIPELECVVCTGSQQEASEMFVFTSIVCQPDTTTHYRAQTLLILLFLLQQFPSLIRHKYSPLRTNTAYPVIPASAIPELECVVCTGSQQEASEMFVFTSIVCQSDTSTHHCAQTLLILLFLLQQFPSLIRHKYSPLRTNTAYPAIPASAIPELECVVCTGSQQEASEMFVFTSIVCQPDTTTHYRAQTLLILLFLLQQFPSLSV
ncbi:hypothetical protein J6590_088749 [Homalodisca vitripennis]|nr:hypothetical protein J6590_088749 [Homalodisca vitripennis]